MDSREDRPGRRTSWSTARTSTRPSAASILGRRPRPEERPRWDRLLQFAREPLGPGARRAVLPRGQQRAADVVRAGAALDGLPAGPAVRRPSEKVVDIAIQRTLAALADRDDDVLLVSGDGDFLEGVEGLLDGSRRVGVVGFTEFRNHEFNGLVPRGLECIDLEYDVEAFTARLPRVRIIPIDEFDPLEFL